MSYLSRVGLGHSLARFDSSIFEEWNVLIDMQAHKNSFTLGCGSLGVASHAWVVCQLKRLVPGRWLLRRSCSRAVLKLAGVARLIGPDGKWSVLVKLLRRVCAVSKLIFTYINLYESCTYKYMNSCTCMYMLHSIYSYSCTCTYNVHTCTWMYVTCKHVQTCLYHVQQRTYHFAHSCHPVPKARWKY